MTAVSLVQPWCCLIVPKSIAIVSVGGNAMFVVLEVPGGLCILLISTSELLFCSGLAGIGANLGSICRSVDNIGRFVPVAGFF